MEWLREQAARGDAEAIAALEVRGEKLPDRSNGMDFSGSQPVVANRIADWDCAVVDGGQFGRHPSRLTGSDEYRTAVLHVEKRLRTGVRFQDEAPPGAPRCGSNS